MADYVLVHGGNMSVDTWNRLTTGDPLYTEDGTLGGMIWDGTAAFLEMHGHRAFAPTLADENVSTLSGHIEEICGLIMENELNDLIIVGHSYGGMIITGVADRMPERMRRLVYLDAALPDPGQSLFEIIASTGVDPLSFAGLEPAPPYTEKLEFDPSRIERLPKTYILCTKSEFSGVTALARKKIADAKEGWTYLELPASHVPMADMPEEFNKILLDASK